jgi:acyl-homoserine lactone acylase PvdQ
MGDRFGARSSAIAAFAAIAALASFAPPAMAGVEEYGANDAGGFRNVLPPGEAGTDNAVDLAAFNLNGTLPPHWDDQVPLYDGLIGASADSGFGQDEVEQYFKDATFGVSEGDVERTETPRPGVTILRDSGYGVPHIYGETRDDALFGAGYANAEDRLFLMDILRHTGRAELSSFIGGSPSNRAMDAAQWQFAPYTDADLQEQIDRAGEFYGAEGEALVADLQSYADGINAYIAEALANPTKLPAEYAAIGKLPQPWELTDSVAEASLIGGIFGKGGGRELDSAQTMQAFVDRFGRRAGRRAWLGFRSKNDPEAPTTVAQRFPYETTSAFAKRGLALPDRGTVEPAPVNGKDEPPSPPTGGTSEFGHIGAELMEALRSPGHASNWELVSAQESDTGHPIGVLGPQVGYYQPQILMEMDVHGPGIDARGATFPGVGLYVLLGHGRDYAWSATTATADNVDTVAEPLCQDDFHYRYKGECLEMEELDRQNTWTPNAVDDTPPGTETLKAYRTVHGIVFARGEVHGKAVAFVIERSTYFHEADSALFFKRMNDPEFMQDGPDSFRRAASKMNFLFNWSYIDSEHIAYYQTGWMPQRARRTSPDFPVMGGGRYDWQGYDPERHTADWLPLDRHPHAVDPPFLVSWNNKQAPGWAAADDQYAYGPMHRSQLISDRVRRGTRGAKTMALPELVQSMEEPATEDLRAVKLLPILLRAVGKRGLGKLGDAVDLLREWRAAGGHRRDLDGDEHDEFTPAIQLMDAWWPLLVEAEFKPELGGEAFDRLRGMLPVGDHTRGAPTAPDYFGGWWGYVSKDLRQLFGRSPRGAYSRVYCGEGSRSKCRGALRRSLADAVEVTADDLYGQGDCSDDAEPHCFDLNRSTVTSGIEIPPMEFQNRPTFQQAVSVTKSLP